MTNRSTGKNLLYSFILIVVLFLFVELVLSVFLYHKKSDDPLATVEAARIFKAIVKGKPNPVNVPNQQLVRPDSSEMVNKTIAEETHLSNKFEYEPWVEFRNIDYKGHFVNVENAIRRSIPASYINPASSDTLDIYFFGGSTMFGFNVADRETIPSVFVEQYRQRFPQGKSIRVFNVATPTYYSYQELVQLSNLVFHGTKPDIVVFLDGVNDFWFAKASYYNQSYFSYILRQVFSQDLLTTGKFNFRDSADQMFVSPNNIPEKQFNDQLIENYFNNIRNARMMSEFVNAKSYFFCQPVPFYKYPNQQQDPICFKDTNTRYNYIYPLVEQRGSTQPGFIFLGNMLEQEKGIPFVDGLHYSPTFIRKVTGEMIVRMEKDLQ